jgi:hypothetical protein
MRKLVLILLLVGCDEDAMGAGGDNTGRDVCMGSAECEGARQTYQSCLNQACDTYYRVCFGPDYASGIYNDGPCSSYYNCVNGCGCNDAVCQTSCGQPPVTCTECLAGPLQVCLARSGCTQPACDTPVYDAGSNVTGACNRLAACCATLTGSAQTQCSTLYQNLSPAGDSTCADIIPSFCR